MSEIRRRSRYEEDLATAQEIVARQTLPDFVTRFEIRFGEFDGDPAMWVIFRTAFPHDPEDKLLRAQLDAMKALREGVQADLLEAFEDRWPYTRFEPEPTVAEMPR